MSGDSPPGRRDYTTYPCARAPLSVVASAILALFIAAAALFSGAVMLAGYLALAACVPWAGRPGLRTIGAALALGGVAWCIYALGLAPALSGHVLEGPCGGPAWVLGVAAAALVARVAALRSEATVRWTKPSWNQGVTAPILGAVEAVAVALRSPPGDREALDQAVVALAAAPSDVVPEGEADRRAFWINVYNALAAHAGRGRRSTRFDDVLEVFRTTYEIASARLSLDDIEHGLLRNGAPPPATPWARLPPGDPRMRWAVPLDPRIHFALNCGAMSCPPVRVYTGEDLDAQLALAKASFLEAESSWDEAMGVLETSQILSWYQADFGGEEGARRLVAEALGVDEARAARAKLRYRPYNWKAPDEALAAL
jgi:hypothetical protein